MKKILVLLFAVSFISCQFDPYAHLYLTQQPSREDVAGTYFFEFQTLDDTTDDDKVKKRKARIELYKSGAFEMFQMPSFQEKESAFMEYQRKENVSIPGLWKIRHLGSVGNNDTDTQKIWGVIFEDAPEDLKYGLLTGKIKPDGLIFGFGDPDQGKVILLEKSID